MSKVVKITKNKKKSKNHSGFLGLILVTLIFCFLLLSPIFAVDNIEVKGNNNVLSKYIVTKSGLFYGQNIFNMNKFDAIERIEQIPQIEETSIKRMLPDTIIINVTEKQAIAKTTFYGSELLISDDGDILQVITDNETVNLPKLSGITVKDVITGEKIICSENETFEKYLSVLKILKKNDMVKNVEKLTYKDGILIHFNVGHIAFLGEAENLEYKMSWLKGIFEREENPSYIDLHNLEKVVTKPVWGMFDDDGNPIENNLRGETDEE